MCLKDANLILADLLRVFFGRENPEAKPSHNQNASLVLK
jgi:hypothetical protein